MGKHGRELVTRADKHRSRGHVSDWNDNRVPPCRDFASPHCFRFTGANSIGGGYCSMIQLFLDFLFLTLEIIGSVQVEACNSKCL